MSVKTKAAHLWAVVSPCDCGHPEELPTVSQQGPRYRTGTFQHCVQLRCLEQPLQVTGKLSERVYFISNHLITNTILFNKYIRWIVWFIQRVQRVWRLLVALNRSVKEGSTNKAGWLVWIKTLKLDQFTSSATFLETWWRFCWCRNTEIFNYEHMR